MPRMTVRLIIPDTHGSHVDKRARDVCLRDAKRLCPDEVVLLGDHLDCGGVFSVHQRSYTAELTESFENDCEAANLFLELLQKACPRARMHYLEGNHEANIERWASRSFASAKDAEGLLATYGPVPRLKLKSRGIKYYRRSVHYNGLSIPGTIRLGKCYYTHGIGHSKHATHVHLERFSANVVHGHTHRSQASIERTVTSDGFGAWCPGTLAKLQPLYKHTTPTSWSHGYAVQFVVPTGRFIHINVPIFGGDSLLPDMLRDLEKRKRH